MSSPDSLDPPTLVRPAFGIAAGMLLGTAAAAARLALSGRLLIGPPGMGTGWFAAVFAVGMIVAGIAYLVAVRRASAPLTLRHLLLAFAVHICAFPAPPFTSNDIFMTLAYGRLAWIGLNPYTHAPRELPPDDPFRRVDWPRTPSPYGPPIVLLASAISDGRSVRQAVVIFKLLMLTSVLGAVVVAYLHCRRFSGREGASCFVAFAFSPVLAWEVSGQAHNDGPMLFATTVFAYLAATSRHWLAWFSLVLALATKFAVAPVLCLYWLFNWGQSRRRAALMALVAVLVVAGLWVPYFEGFTTWSAVWVAATSNTTLARNSLAALALGVARMVRSDLAGAAFATWMAFGCVLLAVAALRYASRAVSLPAVMSDSLKFMLLCECCVTRASCPGTCPGCSL
jgi:hypothetical protein